MIIVKFINYLFSLNINILILLLLILIFFSLFIWCFCYLVIFNLLMMLLKFLCVYDIGIYVLEWSKLYKILKYFNLLVFIFLKSVIKISIICKYKKLN